MIGSAPEYPWASRFHKYIVVAGADDCWLWTGSLSRGYGRLRVAGLTLRSHRLAWILAHGPIPRDICVLHRCDVRACCNPGHLFLGTTLDNIRDAQNKGRISHGEAHHHATLTEDAIRIIRNTPTTVDLAKRFKVSTTTIRLIQRGILWRHVK